MRAERDLGVATQCPTHFKSRSARVTHPHQRDASLVHFRKTNHWILAGVVTAIVLWCGIHTVGVWRHDSRGAIVVIACAGLFFGLWMLGFILGKTASSGPTQADVPVNRWNLCCASALVTSLLSAATLAPVIMRGSQTVASPLLYGGASLGCAALAVILALVGLSHPVIQRGKMYGVAALGIVLLVALATCVCFL